MRKSRENYEQLSFFGVFGDGIAEWAQGDADAISTKTETNRQAENVEKVVNTENTDKFELDNQVNINTKSIDKGVDIRDKSTKKAETDTTERNKSTENDIKAICIEENHNKSTEKAEKISKTDKLHNDSTINAVGVKNSGNSTKRAVADSDISVDLTVVADMVSGDKTTKSEVVRSEKSKDNTGNDRAIASGGAGKRDKDWDFFNQLFSFRNLYRAHLRSRNSKREVPSVVDYEMHISSNITRLRYNILHGVYAINSYKTFYIYEPKKRLIQACAYVDRIVQHCLCDNYLTELIDSKLIYDNCACRKNKGLDFAVRRVKKHLQGFYKQYGTDGYCLRVDISKYFQSIDKEIVLKKLNRHVTNRYIMGLISRIVLGYGSEGLPIGNQISQTLAIYYLNDVDRFIKEVCRVKFYTRYMDDFFILHHDKAFLEDLTRLIREECEKDKLTLNAKTMIIPIKQGIDFIGKNFMLEDNGAVTVRLRQVNKRRIYRRIKYVAQTVPVNEQETVHKRSVMASYTGLTKRIDGGRKLVFNARMRGEKLARRRKADELADGEKVRVE